MLGPCYCDMESTNHFDSRRDKKAQFESISLNTMPTQQTFVHSVHRNNKQHTCKKLKFLNEIYIIPKQYFDSVLLL